MDINKLQEHKLNRQIYRDDSISELVQDIKENGLKEKIVITPNNVIISGHRRVQALKELEITEVDPDIYTGNDEIAELLSHNKYRTKTLADKIREIDVIFDMEVEKALKRKITSHGVRTTTDAHSETGRVTDIVAKKAGISAYKVREGRKIVELTKDMFDEKRLFYEKIMERDLKNTLAAVQLELYEEYTQDERTQILEGRRQIIQEELQSDDIVITNNYDTYIDQVPDAERKALLQRQEQAHHDRERDEIDDMFESHKSTTYENQLHAAQELGDQSESISKREYIEEEINKIFNKLGEPTAIEFAVIGDDMLISIVTDIFDTNEIIKKIN